MKHDKTCPYVVNDFFPSADHDYLWVDLILRFLAAVVWRIENEFKTASSRAPEWKMKQGLHNIYLSRQKNW